MEYALHWIPPAVVVSYIIVADRRLVHLEANIFWGTIPMPPLLVLGRDPRSPRALDDAKKQLFQRRPSSTKIAPRSFFVPPDFFRSLASSTSHTLLQLPRTPPLAIHYEHYERSASTLHEYYDAPTTSTFLDHPLQYCGTPHEFIQCNVLHNCVSRLDCNSNNSSSTILTAPTKMKMTRPSMSALRASVSFLPFCVTGKAARVGAPIFR
ncbi:hypothetical protein C8R43DRAFT_971814 [Mycena crocata]|nr:hypothetical protein C8R43DRAFT_971814 [Mycena crocata]